MSPIGTFKIVSPLLGNPLFFKGINVIKKDYCTLKFSFDQIPFYNISLSVRKKDIH